MFRLGIALACIGVALSAGIGVALSAAVALASIAVALAGLTVAGFLLEFYDTEMVRSRAAAGQGYGLGALSIDD